MDAISGAGGASGATGSVNRFNEMSSEDFVEIIFAELTRQDPLQPNDTSALLEQLNSIRSIESDVALANQLETLVTQNQMSSASGFIGKIVQGLTDEARPVTGAVVAVSRADQDVYLELDNGWRVSMDNLQVAADPELL